MIGWEELPDLSGISSRKELEELVRSTYPDAGKRRVAHWVGQLWAFRERMQAGDLVVLPLKKQSAIAIGTIAGPYAFRTDLPADTHHTRATKWIKTDIPRSRFDQDLLSMFGAYMTVCQLQRHHAEERIHAIITGQAPPILASDETDEVSTPVDLEQFAADDLTEFITRRFKGHELTRLIDEILKRRATRRWSRPPVPTAEWISSPAPAPWASTRRASLCR